MGYSLLLGSSFTPDQVQQSVWTVVPEVILGRGHAHAGPLGCRVGLNAGQEVQELCAQVL